MRQIKSFSPKKIQFVRISSIFSSIFLSYLARNFDQGWVFLFPAGVLLPSLFSKIIFWIEPPNELTDILNFTDRMAIHIKTGQSLRLSLKMTIAQVSLESKLHERILSCLEYNQLFSPKSLLEAKTWNLIKEFDRSGFKINERLRSFRIILRAEQSFGSRLQQAQLQTQIQAFFMVALYISASIFSVFEFGWRQAESWLIYSSVPFFVGLMLILRIGKSFSWKI